MDTRHNSKRPGRALAFLAMLLAGTVASTPLPTFGSLGSGAALAAAATAEAQAPKFAFDADDIAQPDGLPVLGKWMIAPDGTVAHWLGGTYEGKHLREPINVILLDHGAADAAHAKERLAAAAAAAGYPSRRGHSSGYRGYIDGEFYGQLPVEEEHAFSNRVYILNNYHGRVFGPAPFEGGYLFIAAFSRERVAPFATPEHQYGSFDEARDHFTQALNAESDYAITGFIDLDNVILGEAEITTGDHDGRAVMLRAD